MIIRYFQPYKFYFRLCILDYLEFKTTYFHYLVQLRELLVFMEYETAYSHIVVTLGQVEVKELVDFLYFQTG